MVPFQDYLVGDRLTLQSLNGYNLWLVLEPIAPYILWRALPLLFFFHWLIARLSDLDFSLLDFSHSDI